MDGTEPDSARAVWSTATTFPELCELGARFVAGELAYFPGWGAEVVDEESVAIAPRLALLNRAGFLTVASQRGAPDAPGADGRTERRRAFVCGFAHVSTAQVLAGLAGDGLVVTSFGSEEQGGSELPVGIRGQDVFLVAGKAAGPQELELFERDLSPAGMDALRASRYVSVVDLVWGRDDRLWSRLGEVLRAEY